MKFSVKTKIVLSHMSVILITLMLFAWFTDFQISNHVDDFMRGSFPGLDRGPERFLEAVEQSLAWTFLGASIIAIIFSLFLAKFIVDPLEKITAATKKIAAGKYDTRLPIHSEDEIGQLTASLNQMAEDLEEHQFLQKELIANLSHELGTPLTNMKGYLEALQDKVIKGKKRDEAIIIIKEESERLEKMLREVRELAVIQQPKFRVSKKKEDLKKLCQQAIKKAGNATNHSIVLDAPKKHYSTPVDKDRFTQILINLLSNAVKFSPSEKPITLSLEQDAKCTHIRVKDEGPGIKKSDLPYIFERFYQADRSRSRMEEKDEAGIGIGLAIVKELVEAHGGKIHAESTMGAGSTFHIQLPV